MKTKATEKQNKEATEDHRTMYDLAMYQLRRYVQQGNLEAIEFVLTNPILQRVKIADVLKRSVSK